MAIFHLYATTGTRAGGQSARAKIDYLSRGGKYARDGDEVLHTESGHMPGWGVRGRSERARKAATAYWRAADTHERINGRLYKHLQLGLPHELSLDAQIQLVRAFAHNRASDGIEGGSLPYTFTLHRGKGKNIQADILLSERINDGHARTAATWFKRAAASPKGRPLDPTTGGARKTDLLKSEEWLLETRAKWASVVNGALAAAGIAEVIDHRSLAAQGSGDAPTIHVGVRASAMMRRQITSERAALHAEIAYANAQRRAMEVEAAKKELECAAATTALERVKQKFIDEHVTLLHEVDMPMAWEGMPLPNQPVRGTPQPTALPAPRPVGTEKQEAWERARHAREQWLYTYYGNTSALLARYWRMRRVPERQEMVFEQKDGRLVDMGAVIVAEHGHDAEVGAIIELIRLKGWQSVHFSGDDNFLLRAMTAALQQGIAVTARTAHERHMLEQAQRSFERAGIRAQPGQRHA
ncbi:MAG TPA: MobA/MobL family protein [Noviherbaspirillum sp.]|nr:MobA/MobL family protein [Noviherbaspirillum sp.]